MLNVDGIARAAYDAYREVLDEHDVEELGWEQLAPSEQEAWIAAVSKALDLAEAAVF